MSMSLRRFLVFVGLLALSVASRAQGGAASLAVDFAVPSGYGARQAGDFVQILPQTMGHTSTPCAYALWAPRPSKGSLEADAEAALAVEMAAAGMQRSNDSRVAMRGVAAGGWPYFVSGGEFHLPGQLAGNSTYLAMWAMAFPASANRVSVVLGAGSLVPQCTFNDAPFEQLFHSLRPHGWPSPSGNALERDLIGHWEGRMLSMHTFHADGRYSSSASGQLYGQAISSDPQGRYALRGSEVTITTRVQRTERFRVHIYDKWNNSRWERALTVLYDDRMPPSVAEYVRTAQ
jgi:hypothetical protein